LHHLFLCVRVPKSGSLSLSGALKPAFVGQQTFLLPHTLDFDGRIARFQKLRFNRTWLRNLFKLYGTFDTTKVFANINKRAQDGDLIDGGHLDFRFVEARIKRPLKIISILRDPYERVRSEYNYARQSFRKKRLLERADAGLLPKMATRYSFTGFLDFLLEHKSVYGDIAAAYLGWRVDEPLGAFDAQNVFHCGVLEKPAAFVKGLSDRLGRLVEMPHLNRTFGAGADALDAAQKQRIEALYPRDFELYERYTQGAAHAIKASRSPKTVGIR
jgi:Sulfotransferase domain